MREIEKNAYPLIYPICVDAQTFARSPRRKLLSSKGMTMKTHRQPN